MTILFNKLLIIDASYMLHRQLHVQNLWDLKTSEGQRTGGIFGFLRSLNKAISDAPKGYYPVCVWDSGLSQRRLAVYPNYKHYEDNKFDEEVTQVAESVIKGEEFPDIIDDENYLVALQNKIKELMENTDKPKESPEDDYLYQYRTQRNLLIDILNNLGVKSIKYPGTEGDDLQYLLSKMTESSIIVTDDSDLQQLVSPNVSIMKVLKGTTFVTWRTIIEDWKLPDASHLARVKAIVGDSSDNVPQLVKGLGEVTANKVVDVINEFNQNPEEYLPALRVRYANKPVIQKFIKCHDNYLRNLQLVDLQLVEEDQDIITYLINELSTSIKVDYMGALSKLGKLEIANVPVDEIIQFSVASYSSIRRCTYDKK